MGSGLAGWRRSVSEWAASSWHRLILAITFFYILATGVFLAGSLMLLRAEAIDAGERTLSAFATIAAEQSTRTIQSIDQTLLLARNILARQDAADVARDPAVQSAIRDLLVDRPFLRSFWVLNAEGRIVFNSSARYVGDDVSDRAFFRHYKDHPDRDFEIHLPVRARATGQWYMTITRSWRHPDGALAGVIVATPERAYFESVWRIAEIGDSASVSLFHGDGVLLMRSPYLESAMGRSFASSPVFGKLLDESPAGNYQEVSDGVDRVLAYRQLSAYPNLVIIVGQSLEQILGSWRRYLWIAVMTWAVSSLAAAGGIAALLRSLRSSEQRLETARVTNQRIFETSVDLILVADAKGNLIQVSPSALPVLGYRPEEMVGHNGVEFTHPDDLEATRNEMRAARRTRTLRRFDARYLHKDGRALVMAWAGQWSEVAQQHFFIGRDMTEQQATELQLRQAQKMEAIGQLTGGIAHDFNNLLTVVLGNAELLAESLKHDPDSKELAGMIARAAERGSELTRSLLAFARKQALEPKATDVNRLVSGMKGLLRRTLGEQVEIEFKSPGGIWPTMVDPAQLEAAVLNLAVNARDAMANGGRLTIETANVVLDDDYARQNAGASAGAFVALSVADTGTGMTPEVLARAFEPFFTTKEVGKGSGLGLSMIYGFARQSNGHIKIYSEVGHGTTVKIYLPRASQPDLALVDDASATAPEGGTETILMVEDDDMVRAFVEQQLASLGYRVIAARNGPEALETLRQQESVELLFTDVVMPGGLNGPQLAAEARRLKPNIRVLYTSGYTENAIVHQGRLDAGVELLSKPYRRTELAAKLRKVLNAEAGG
jgi:PAS domain S-box-containing protein